MQLIDIIEAKALERGMDFSEFTDLLGFTEAYYRTFRNGNRWIGTIGHDKLEKIAAFVEMPLASVYVLAGILKPTDFVLPSDLSEKIRKGISKLRRNPVLGPFAPPLEDWEKTPQSVQFMMILLYERLTTEELMEKGSNQFGVKLKRRKDDVPDPKN